MRLVGTTVLVLAVILAACDKPSGTTPTFQAGPAADVARQVGEVVAPNADIVDQPFEDLMARADLAKMFGARSPEIADQIRKSRTAVAAARASSSASHGQRLASVMGSVGTFSVPQFASTFAFSLDQLTKKNGTIPMPGNPFSDTKTGETSFTTTTLSTTEIFSGEGSVVTGTLRWSYSTITIDSKTGATLLHLTDDRELVGTINVCPAEGGVAPATLKVTSKIVMQGSSATTTRTSTGNSKFQGKVSGQAALQNVTQQQKSEASWQSTSGDGGYNADTSSTWNAGANGYLGGLQPGSINVTLSSNGSASAADAAKAAGWDIALDAYALEAAFQKAQELWRKGRCVIVAVPEYNAETPIETLDQEKSQHTEEVQVSSDTKFRFQLKLRFGGGTVIAPTTAALTSGKEKLEPNRTEGSSGQLTYKADSEEDKEAKAQLQATSERGIGTLVLTFRTTGALTLSVQGSFRFNSPGSSPVTSLTVGPASFTRKDDKTFVAHPGYTGRTRLEPPHKDCPDLLITETGTLEWTATIEKRGETSVWVVQTSGRGNVTAKGTGGNDCDASETEAVGGLFVGLFLEAVGNIEIPAEGGTVQLRGGSGLVRNATATGTATGTVSKK